MADRKKYGLLTENQLLTLYYKSKGLSLREIARRFHTSHQNISVAYRRALRNVELAEKTLFYYHLATASINLVIPAGAHLADIPTTILKECDRRGIKLRADVTLIFKIIRFKHRKYLEGNRIMSPLLILIDRDGELSIYPIEEIRREYEEAKRILEEAFNR